MQDKIEKKLKKSIMLDGMTYCYQHDSSPEIST